MFYVERDGNAGQYQKWERGQPYENKVKFPHHKLIYVSPQNATQWSKWWYAADRHHQDLYNYQWSSTEIGGRRLESVTRSYLIPRDEFEAGDPAPGAAMRLTPTSVFGSYGATDFVLAHSKQSRAPQELDSLYVAVDRVWVRRCVTESLGWDDATSGILTKRSTLYYRGEVVLSQYGIQRTVEWLFANPQNPFWGLSIDGVVTDGEKLNCDWYVIEEREVIPGGLESSSSGGGGSSYGRLIRQYGDEDEMYWPPILANGDWWFKPITYFVDQTRTTTFTRDSIRFELVNPAYHGPTRLTVAQYWSKTPVALPQVVKMMPKAIVHDGANYDFKLEPTLHGSVYLEDKIGTKDPKIAIGDYSDTYPATNYTTWPGGPDDPPMIVGTKQQPFRGGYMITISTAERPDCYVP